jgi:hypothetical protein
MVDTRSSQSVSVRPPRAHRQYHTALSPSPSLPGLCAQVGDIIIWMMAYDAGETNSQILPVPRATTAMHCFRTSVCAGRVEDLRPNCYPTALHSMPYRNPHARSYSRKLLKSQRSRMDCPGLQTWRRTIARFVPSESGPSECPAAGDVGITVIWPFSQGRSSRPPASSCVWSTSPAARCYASGPRDFCSSSASTHTRVQSTRLSCRRGTRTGTRPLRALCRSQPRAPRKARPHCSALDGPLDAKSLERCP